MVVVVVGQLRLCTICGFCGCGWCSVVVVAVVVAACDWSVVATWLCFLVNCYVDGY